MEKKITLNIEVPSCWQELTPKQLRYVYFLLSEESYSFTEIKTLVFFRWSEMQDIYEDGSGYFMKYQGRPFHLSALQVAEVLPYLNWVEQLPTYPVRLEEVAGKKTTIEANLQGLSFEQYLMLDNLYQGYLATKNKDLLGQMACTLYSADSLQLMGEEEVSIFYWWASAKAMLSRQFTYFFQPSSESSSSLENLQETVDTMIRALTKGDITKEKEILAMDMYRALTELNAQAKDAEELKKQTQAL